MQVAKVRLPLSHSRRQYFSKKTKSRLTWGAVIIGAVGLWKGLDWLTEYLDQTEEPEKKEKIVVLGSGFAAVAFLQNINTTKFDVTVVSPRSYFLYTPLLSDGAVGTVAVESIVEPIRSFGERTKSKFDYYEASCLDVDVENNTIVCKSVLSNHEDIEIKLPYDKLIIAVGAKNATHKVTGIENVNFLNSLNDARRLRNRLLDSLEEASFPDCSEERKKQLLHFVIVGGGPIARKIASQISDFLDEASHSFKDLAPYIKVTQFSYQDHIHNYYDHVITSYVKKELKKRSHVLKIDEIRGAEITQLDKNKIIFKNAEGKSEDLPYSVCVWSTGIAPHELVTKVAQKFPTEQYNQLALLVDPELRLLGSKNIFSIGDCASLTQNAMVTKWEKIFTQADINSDGYIDLEEINSLCVQWGKKFPALIEINSRAQEFFNESDADKDGRLSMDEFKIFLRSVDSHLTRFPSTSGVSVQQGQYLASCLNKGTFDDEDREMNPSDTFRYKHIGGYEYIGAESGLRERGSQGGSIMNGMGAYWLWNNVFYSTVISVPMRVKMVSSRIWSILFGRESTRY